MATSLQKTVWKDSSPQPQTTSSTKQPNKRVFAFDRVNFILLAIGMAIVIIGMILMSGSGSNETNFNPAIFDARHIKVAPMVCLFGYLFIIYGIMRKPQTPQNDDLD